jgi:hypothetical protein
MGTACEDEGRGEIEIRRYLYNNTIKSATSM